MSTVVEIGSFRFSFSLQPGLIVMILLPLLF
jgi:hypothetical protein